ncbi:hypothetical protein VPH35_116535 [Triticum aestivum]
MSYKSCFFLLAESIMIGKHYDSAGGSHAMRPPPSTSYTCPYVLSASHSQPWLMLERARPSSAPATISLVASRQTPLSPSVIAPTDDAILYFLQQRLCCKSCPATSSLLHKFLDSHCTQHHLFSDFFLQQYLCCKSPPATSSMLQKK